MAIKKLYIDEEVIENPLVDSIQSNLGVPFEIIQDSQQLYQNILDSDDPIQKGKELLYLTRNKGAFVKKCPGTKNYTCCDYMILNIGTYCHMDCSYCILQSYFHPPVLQYFVNQNELFDELDSLFSEKKTYRIGTGEYTDSLIWEAWTDLSCLLVPKFAAQSYNVLELKTKTVSVQKLKALEHNRKTIISWSVNAESIISKEERHTATLSARLKAAARCESWGYPLAFHFDPIVIYDGCEKDYHEVIKRIFSHVSSNNIVWISLGSFRFIPSLKNIIQNRFTDSKIIYGEFIQGLDNKMRYFKPLRIKLYQKMVLWIKEFAPDTRVYFCMEDDEVWEKCMGINPSDHGGLPRMLDLSAQMHCGLDS